MERASERERGEGDGSDFLTVPDMLLFVACDSSPILEAKMGGFPRPQLPLFLYLSSYPCTIL
jgi:hypothetical protein